MATSSSTADRTLEILAEIAETDEVRRDVDVELFDLGLLDSLGMVQLMIALSECFGIEISPAEFVREEWSTPRKIVAYVEQRVDS